MCACVPFAFEKLRQGLGQKTTLTYLSSNTSKHSRSANERQVKKSTKPRTVPYPWQRSEAIKGVSTVTRASELLVVTKINLRRMSVATVTLSDVIVEIAIGDR